jgi:hypothetical protein
VGIAQAWPFKIVDAPTLNHFMKNALLDRGENARNRSGDPAIAPVSDGAGVLNRREICLRFRNPHLSWLVPYIHQPLNMLATNPGESDNVANIVARGEVRVPPQSQQ